MKNASRTFRLAGKVDDMLVTGVSVGDRCSVTFDQVKNKYAVESDEGQIGFLPPAAVRFAEDHDQDPERLQVIVSAVEYDEGKGRDLIDVIVSV